MAKKPSPYWITVSNGTRDAAIHFSPSAERNAGPILEVLSGLLPQGGNAVEIASGTGQHAAAFARTFPGLHWTPSDPHPDARASIAARRETEGLANLAAPLDIDLTRPRWHAQIPAPLAALLAINVIHISPWEATLGLLDGAAATLATDGVLYTYGPYCRDGAHTSQSNADFDASLRSRNPAWGIRDTADIADAAAARGLTLADIFEMPANNLSLAFRR